MTAARQFPSNRCAFVVSALVTLAGLGAAQIPSFIKGTLSGASPNDPTSLAFGPDGRLYVTERIGRIHAYTITRTGVAAYTVTQTETLEQVFSRPNHLDDGTPDPTTVGRQCTGIAVAGTAQNPVLYVTSSDPRVAFGADSGLDTNSGIVTRLTWNGASWDDLDLVRGLPRSEENHATNGLVLDPASNTLYVSQGGNTNMGAPATGFGSTPEYALSAAILTIDLDAIGDTTYDIPSLDDPSRPNTGPGGADENDPFGGNDGANQAMIVNGGPVQVYAPGFRNAYGIVIHSQGWIYTIDNGPNINLGGEPLNCTVDPNEVGAAYYPDGLHRIGVLGDGGGYYGGHPNPFRASAANTINGQSPIPVGWDNSIECTYLVPGATDGSLVAWTDSTNGLCEFTASSFGGSMQGDLLTVGWGTWALRRIRLAQDGSLQHASVLETATATLPLDVVAQSDGDAWPGTIWIAAFGNDGVIVFEPDEPADLVAVPGLLGFGDVFPGTSVTLTADVDNIGFDDATISSIQVTGDPAFQLGANPVLPLVLGASSPPVGFEVVYAPALAGPATGTLLVHHDGDGSPVSIDLAGEGSTPDFNVIFRINCGGPQVNAVDGTQPWEEDSSAQPSTYVNSTQTNQTAVGGVAVAHASVPSAAPASLFSTDRYDEAGGFDMQWALPMPPDTQAEVRLFVAENSGSVTAAGQRIFDVVVEGQLVSGIDAYGEGGASLGFARSIVVDVSDQVLDIEFLHGVGEPSIKAIEVRRPSYLVSSRPLISVIDGGAQDLYLTAVNFATKGYLLLSSISGTVPGIPLGSVLLPLNVDSFFLFSIENANAPPYVNSLGAFDADGSASASFVVPSNLPLALAGVVVWHAALVFEGGTVLAATPEAVRLELTD